MGVSASLLLLRLLPALVFAIQYCTTHLPHSFAKYQGATVWRLSTVRYRLPINHRCTQSILRFSQSSLKCRHSTPDFLRGLQVFLWEAPVRDNTSAREESQQKILLHSRRITIPSILLPAHRQLAVIKGRKGTSCVVPSPFPDRW